MPLSYSAAVSSQAGPQYHQTSDQAASTIGDANSNHRTGDAATRPGRRSPSPSHRPATASENEEVYVLTLLTSKAHHDRLTALRKQYFPRHLNKLEAHLTLFHALPGSKLESAIIPVIQAVSDQTAPFQVRATKPFRLRKGIAISVAKQSGGIQAQEVHRALQEPWRKEGFLSEQDNGGCRVHYTIMNKVDDEAEVLKAFQEVEGSFKSDVGTAEGLGLWLYDHGFWKFERKFAFSGAGGTSTG